ncbi:hypothetical protein R3L49_00980 [Wolbachia endosymbiont of Zaprionus taronus]|nr:hypothetical protein [Wolbachia endosymbiont of Zaprionus taronus]
MTNYLTIITPSYRDSFAVSLNIDPLLYLNIDPANKQRDDELLNHHLHRHTAIHSRYLSR